MKLFNIEVSIPEGKMQADCIELLEKSAAYLQCVMSGCDVFLKEVNGAESEPDEPSYYILATGHRNGKPFSEVYEDETDAIKDFGLKGIVDWEWLHEELLKVPFVEVNTDDYDGTFNYHKVKFMRMVMA